MYFAFIETAKSLAKVQYTLYNTGIPKRNSLFGTNRQHPKQEILFKAYQSFLPQSIIAHGLNNFYNVIVRKLITLSLRIKEAQNIITKYTQNNTKPETNKQIQP